MTRSARLVALAVVLMAASALTALAADPPLRGIAINETLDTPPILDDAMPARAGASTLPLLVRLSIRPSVFTGPAATVAFERLAARLALYESRHVPVVVALGALPAAADTESWIAAVRAIVDRGRGHVRAYELGAGLDAAAPIDRVAFLLKRAAVQIRSADAAASILTGPLPATAGDWLARLYNDGAIAPYSDGVVIDGSSDASALIQTTDKCDPGAAVVVTPVQLSERSDVATKQLLDAELARLGSRVNVTAFTASAAPLKDALAAASRVGDLLTGDLVTLDDPSVALKFTAATVDLTSRVPHALLFSPAGAQTYLVYGGASSMSSVDVDIDLAGMRSLMVRDPYTGRTVAPTLVRPREGGQPAHLALPIADHPLILDFNYGETTLSSSADTTRSVLPPVGEIIAKYQQVRVAQDAALESFVADMQMRVQVRPSPAEPDWNAITENRVFSDKTGLEWVQNSFRLNGVTYKTNPPPFPLLQPEKVNSLPLDLRLTDDYRYRLDGVETIGERQAYVIQFEPVRPSPALYRGTIWIDRETFARVRFHALQTPATGVIASNEEDQTFTLAGQIDGHGIWLLNRLVSTQTVLFAGRNLPLERVIEYHGFELNPANFAEQRAAARSSEQLMYRDTDEGVRYFVKRGATRVVSTQATTSARAFAMGADVDPSFDFPLPIAGWNILDFNFMHRDMQLALLFGGVIALGNIQKTHLLGDKVDGSVDFFGLALKGNDAVFDADGERRGERVQLMSPAGGATIGYQITPFHKVTGRYEFKYDAYFADSLRSASFVTPSSTATNGLAAGYEFRRQGYAFTATASAYRRMSWKPWGTGPFDPATQSYRKYDAGISKDFLFKMFHTVHLNAQYFGGTHLDRFSMYQFGMFDATRMHGVPSAVRFSELAMVRASYSFNLFEQYRLDLFLDQARGRVPLFDNGWHSVTGTGVGLTLRGPRSTIIRTDVGKSVLPAFYRGAGSFVLQLMILKPL